MQSKSISGFTLIELLLVVVIIGILLAVIVPRAWRANIDSKYGLVRQNATELVAFAGLWVEQEIESQQAISVATMTTYFNTLSNSITGAWVATSATNNNWTSPSLNVNGRNRTTFGTATAPSTTVQGLVPPERIPRNPFNGASIFAETNFPATTPIPGALACGRVADDGFFYFGLVFQGTDNETIVLADANTFHAGQAVNTLPGLRNGVFMARISQAGNN